MPSRMERYYQQEVDVSKRTKKNQHLYNEIHNNTDYDDVKQIPNVNAINPEKLNELLNGEKKQQRRVIKNSDLNLNVKDDGLEEKNYDIREVLEKAKTEKNDSSYNYHKLKEEQINLLKKIESYKASKKEQDESFNELLNTIASTKLLKELNDKELSLDLLDDLKSNNDNTVIGGIDSIDRIMNDVPKAKKEIDENNEIDKSFYTASMSFNEDDFDEIRELKTKINKNNTFMKVMFIVLSIIIIIILILLLIN